MVKSLRLLVVALASLGALAACASQSGPPQPPSVVVRRLMSTVITPDVIKFEAQIVVHNNMGRPLDLEKVDYGSSLFTKQLFSSTFSELKRMNGNGDETITFPFQISMKDVLSSGPELLANGKLKVTFDGLVYPQASFGFAPIQFSRTIEIPIPKIPEVGFAGANGLPGQGGFEVDLAVKNTNNFPISVARIDTYLVLNGERYTLLRTGEATNIQPGQIGTVALQMENTTGKALSMILNAIMAQSADFTLGGSLTCGTPFGWIYVPVAVQGHAK